MWKMERFLEMSLKNRNKRELEKKEEIKKQEEHWEENIVLQ